MSYSLLRQLAFFLGALAVITLAFCFVRRWKKMYRQKLPRVFELRDMAALSSSPDAYFKKFEQSLSEIPQKLKQFRDIEQDLRGLDASAWAFLKTELAPLLTIRDQKRGWQALFDKLNQAKAFNYLKKVGCHNIRFVPPSAIKGQQTPDLQADGVLCEVKTINISEAEADRRATGGVGTSMDHLDEGFFRKLSSNLRKAKDQMKAYDAGSVKKYIVYIIINYDDGLHEYADRYQPQIDQYIAADPVQGLEVMQDIKPPFYTASV